MHPTVITFYVMSGVALAVFLFAIYDVFMPDRRHEPWMERGMIVVWSLFALAILLAVIV